MTVTRRATAAVTAAAAIVAGLLSSPVGATADALPTRPGSLGGQTALAVAAAPDVVATGRPVTITGRLTGAATGAGLAGALVRLEARAGDGSWLGLTTLTTDRAGVVATSQLPDSTTTYRWHYGGDGTPGASVSTTATVAVRRVTAAWRSDAVRVGHRAVVEGVLAADAGSAVRLERRVGDRWSRVARTRAGSDGAYRFSVTPTVPGFSRWRVVDGSGASARLPRLDAFRLHRYSVATRGHITADTTGFRDVVAATYADPRGWLRTHHRFREAGRGHAGEFTVVLSQARYLPAYSSVCSSTYSCRVGRYVIINQERWRNGSPYFPGTLVQYRRMLVNHETGHWLGRGHAYCPGRGRPAPVMQQQSKGMQGCRVNSWPLRREVRAVP